MSTQKNDIAHNIITTVKKLEGFRKDKELAEWLGIAPNVLTNWKLRGIADTNVFTVKGFSEKWIRTGEGSPREAAFSDGKGHELHLVQRIPLLGTVPAGFPQYVPEDVVDWVYRSDLPAESYALKVKGDSMPPLIEGDFVAFIQSGDYRNGDRVVAHNEWGEFMIKRLRIRLDGSQILTSDNPNYPDVEPNEHYRIIGKVIKAWRDIL